jgi:E3 ubiquitin-protein ligase DOA10
MVVDQLHPLILAISFKVPSFLVEFIAPIIKVDNSWMLYFYIFLCIFNFYTILHQRDFPLLNM